MDISKVLDKVRKLRALAQSANEHEAANAAAAAEKLIQEYRLQEADMGAGEVDETVEIGAPSIATWGPRVPQWQKRLCVFLAKQYGCFVFTQDGSGLTQLRAVGRKSDVETLRYQYAFFSAEIGRLAMLKGRAESINWRASYALGAADGLKAAMTESNNAARAAVSTAALVKIDARAVEAEQVAAAAFPLSRGRRSNASVDGGAYGAGQQDGRNLQQKNKIGAGGARLLGGGQ